MLDWPTLLKSQQRLDLFIEKKQKLVLEEIFNRKILALIVEINELANITKVFKFWSNTQGFEDITKPQVLEEYIDVLHFSLSLSNYYEQNIELIYGPPNKLTNIQISDLLLEINLKHYLLLKKETFLDWFKLFLKLGSALGFSEQEIEQSYHKKSNINYQRQQQGY